MAKITLHDDAETIRELNDELPDGVSWGGYVLECIRLRKRIEGRDLILADPETVNAEDKI